jgi:nitrate reductase delta subunit
MRSTPRPTTSQLFDRGRRTSLHLFEHVHGDSRDRGPAMIDLAQTYEKAGLFLAEGEMPDHLPVVLEFASTQPPREAAASWRDRAHGQRHLQRAAQRESPTPACWARCSTWPAKRRRPCRCPPRSRSTTAGPSRWPSTAAPAPARAAPTSHPTHHIVRRGPSAQPGATA